MAIFNFFIFMDLQKGTGDAVLYDRDTIVNTYGS